MNMMSVCLGGVIIVELVPMCHYIQGRETVKDRKRDGEREERVARGQWLLFYSW